MIEAYAAQAMGTSALGIRAQSDPRFETARIFPHTGRLPSGARARVLLLHGIGMHYSSAGSWHDVINVMGAQGKGKSGSTINYVQALQNHVPLAVEAIDLMGHRAGPSDKTDFQSLKSVVDWLANYFWQMKLETPALPLIIVARSASARFAAEVNHRFPGLIDGLVLLSPTVPGGPDRDKLQYEGVLKDANGRVEELHLDNIEWFLKITQGLDWKKPGYFGSTPVLAITGTEDAQVLDDDRADLDALAANLPSFTHREVAGALHNVFTTSKAFKRIGRTAYEHFYEFVHPLSLRGAGMGRK